MPWPDDYEPISMPPFQDFDSVLDPQPEIDPDLHDRVRELTGHPDPKVRSKARLILDNVQKRGK